MGDKSIEQLEGKTLVSATGIVGGDEIRFVTTDGEIFALLHRQDCCESVRVEDIVGDLGDLVGSPLLIAREDSNVPTEPVESEYQDESFTWTFYNLATAKGHVTIRWYGTSNGYYSEGVDFVRLDR